MVHTYIISRDEMRERVNVKPNGHIRRRDLGAIARTVLDKDTPGKRSRGRPRIRWMHNISRDMKTYGLDDNMMEDRKVWSTMVATVDKH